MRQNVLPNEQTTAPHIYMWRCLATVKFNASRCRTRLIGQMDGLSHEELDIRISGSNSGNAELLDEDFCYIW